VCVEVEEDLVGRQHACRRREAHPLRATKRPDPMTLGTAVPV
jgi:hypothetical protein